MAERRSHIIIRRGKTHEVWELDESATYCYSRLVASAPTVEDAKIIRNAYCKETTS